MTAALLTLAEACERLGWGRDPKAQEKLYRRLSRAERRTGKSLMVRGRGPGGAVRVAWKHVRKASRTMSAVERVSGPEFQDDLLELDTKIADISDRRIEFHHRTVTAPELGRLDGQIENVAEAVDQLMERFRVLVSGIGKAHKSDGSDSAIEKTRIVRVLPNEPHQP